jgi:hypothetical protein
VQFRVIGPRSRIIATNNFDSARLHLPGLSNSVVDRANGAGALKRAVGVSGVYPSLVLRPKAVSAVIRISQTPATLPVWASFFSRLSQVPDSRVGCRVMSTRWEYSWFTTGTHHDVNSVLGWAMERGNHFGADGWELVNFQLRENGNEVYIMAMMKRQY